MSVLELCVYEYCVRERLLFESSSDTYLRGRFCEIRRNAQQLTQFSFLSCLHGLGDLQGQGWITIGRCRYQAAAQLTSRQVERFGGRKNHHDTSKARCCGRNARHPSMRQRRVCLSSSANMGSRSACLLCDATMPIPRPARGQRKTRRQKKCGASKPMVQKAKCRKTHSHSHSHVREDYWGPGNRFI